MNGASIIHRGCSRRPPRPGRAGLPGATALLALLAAAAGSHAVQAQIPDSFDNLKVLPQDISKEDLVGVMRSFAGALGVRCSHCHAGPDNLKGMDFATDEKETKRTARAMMLMVKDINGKYLAKLERGKPVEVEVECATCHRSQTMPRFIQDVIETTLEKDGIEAAVARYGELREEYYGGFAYDFTAGPMSGLGEKLAGEGKNQEALAILEMNSGFHPDSTWNRVLTAQVLFKSGRRDEAVAVLEKTLEADPENRFVRGQLEKMKAPPAEKEETP